MSDFVDRAVNALAEHQDLGLEYREEIRDELEAIVRVVLTELLVPTHKMQTVVAANWGRRTWLEFSAIIEEALKF